jgi:enoyl-CoA hydratase/carnithine racemase
MIHKLRIHANPYSTALLVVVLTLPGMRSSSEEAKERIGHFSTRMNKEDAPKFLNKKLMDECIKLGEEITKNSYNAVRVSKMLINKDMDADIQTDLRLETYGWTLCFTHEDPWMAGTVIVK